MANLSKATLQGADFSGTYSDDRIDAQARSRMHDISLILAADMAGVGDPGDDDQIAERLADWSNEAVEELRQLSPLHEYGLALTYEADEENDGQNAHFCWLLSTGGPHEEIRFFVNEAFRLQRAEFVFKGWSDAACVELAGDHIGTLRDLWNSWRDCELPQHLIEQARKR